jgi:pilus assembly protein CpaE
MRSPLLSSRQRGQATVELVAVLPFLLLAALVAWQLVLAGHTAWLAAQAARVAARADAVGRRPEVAARSALPDALERNLGVRRLAGGGIRVSVQVPLLLRHGRSPVTVSATSSLGRGR